VAERDHCSRKMVGLGCHVSTAGSSSLRPAARGLTFFFPDPACHLKAGRRHLSQLPRLWEMPVLLLATGKQLPFTNHVRLIALMAQPNTFLVAHPLCCHRLRVCSANICGADSL